jgi:hypothetical protein
MVYAACVLSGLAVGWFLGLWAAFSYALDESDADVDDGRFILKRRD